MSNIIEDYKKINLQKAALTFIFPDGRVISINKIKGYDYHMQYLKLLAKNYKEIKNVIFGIDLDYYLNNPSEIMTGVWPIFSMAHISIYMNMTPNTIEPTEMGIILLPDDLTKLSRNTLKNMDNKLEEIIFMGIGHYIPKVNAYEIIENEEFSRINSKALFNIIDENKQKRLTKLYKN